MKTKTLILILSFITLWVYKPWYDVLPPEQIRIFSSYKITKGFHRGCYGTSTSFRKGFFGVGRNQVLLRTTDCPTVMNFEGMVWIPDYALEFIE